ncbi:MAG: RNA pyrophosphohydrolase [Alphaproteobacteria bacterium]|nr:RNA pyrophosphohydrolase [Alphaproteobacteria bacterium]MBO4644596.1 RNA pyrophosphohydrolase [Alphaproteobacteria bacterium]
MEKLYRPNVGIMVLNASGDVFMAHRTDSRKQAWQMPQGGIDKGEDEYTAALRELYEETNITSVTLIAESTKWYSYDFPAGVHFISEKKKAFVGQRQKWFLFQFTGDESEINLDKPDPEFNQWQWTTVEKIVDMIVPFKRDVYRQVVDEFMPFIEAVRNG